MTLEIKLHHGKYAIFDNGTIVRSNYKSYSNAEIGLAAYEKRKQKMARQKRPCMTCGNNFMSEGIGNRICDGCKRRGYEPVTSLLL